MSANSNNVKLSNVKRVFKLLLPYWWMIFLIIGTTIVSVWSQLQLPSITGNIINNGVMKLDQNYVWSHGLQMMGIVAIGALTTVASGFLATRIGTGWSRDLRLAVFKKIENFSQNEINKFSTASLITRSTNDIQQIQQTSIMMLRMTLQAPIMAIYAIILAVQQAPTMSWIMWTGMTTLILSVVALFILVIPRFAKIQRLTDNLNLISRENLTGLRIIRAFRNERYEEKKFATANRNLTENTLWINRVLAAIFPLVMMIINFVALAITWFSARGVADGNIDIGTMVSFPQYAIQAIMAFLFIAMLIVFIPRAAVSIGRIGEILNTKISIDFNNSTAKARNDQRGVVEFREVTFSYPDAETPVLTDISFVAKPGQTTAFIGSTGSGKSTIISLIPRFYDVTAGEILVDGQNIKNLDKNDLDDTIGYVPQKGMLFSGTVASNIKYGENSRTKIDNLMVEKSAKIACADFIDELDGKFNARIAQGGSNLSGGQKQRLSIARAIAKNPDILIFDDSFSALDYTTDKKVRKNLADFAKDKTLIIVAQRISTIKDAEQILVLDKGEIVGRGTHSELLQNNEIYREIAKSQFSESEINKEMGIAEKLAKTKQSLQPHRGKQQRADKLQRPGGIAMIRRTYKSTSKPTNKGEKNG